MYELMQWEYYPNVFQSGLTTGKRGRTQHQLRTRCNPALCPSSTDILQFKNPFPLVQYWGDNKRWWIIITMQPIIPPGRKKSELISILNNIETFDETLLAIKKLTQSRHPDSDAMRLQLASYAEQYVSGLDRPSFFQAFKAHNILSLLFTLVQRNKDPNLFIAVMKSLSIILFNLGNREEVEYFLSHASLADLLEVKVDRSGTNEAVEVYIQFLKSVALKVGEHKLVGLFFNSSKPLFPLMWRVISFYNQNEQLIRTTIKSIVVEIVKINDFSVKAYLNNFPSLLFFSLIARYTMDAVTRYLIQSNIHALDVVSDEISFIDDLSTKLQKQTKAFVFNSILYYPIKSLWNSLVTQQSPAKNALLLTLILFFNISDPRLLFLLLTLFFTSRVPTRLSKFLKTPTKQLSLYSKSGIKRELEGSRKVIQKHCQKVFNNFNSDIRQIGDEIISFESAGKRDREREGIFDKSKEVLNGFINSYSWEGYVANEVRRVAEIVGGSLRLYSPVLGVDDNNVYVSSEEEEKEGSEENGFYSQLVKNFSLEPDSLNAYLKVVISILSNPNLSCVHSSLAATFIKQSPDVLRALGKAKTLSGMNNLLHLISICISLLSRQQLLSTIPHIKVQINEMCTESSRDLQQSEWADCFDLFLSQQQYILSFQPHRRVLNVDYDIIDQQPMVIEQSAVYYYYMVRSIILLLLRQDVMTCSNIIKTREKENLDRISCLERIEMVVDGVKARNTIRGRMLQISETETGRIIYEGGLKRLSMKDILTNKIQVNVPTHSVQLEFLGAEEKTKWVQEICAFSKDMEEGEIEAVAGVLCEVPQL